MKCPNCSKETHKTTSLWIKGKRIDFCPYCKNNFSEVIPVNEDYKKRVLYGGGKYCIGLAHLKDIKSRKLDLSTGEVFRDTKKKYFT